MIYFVCFWALRPLQDLYSLFLCCLLERTSNLFWLGWKVRGFLSCFFFLFRFARTPVELFDQTGFFCLFVLMGVSTAVKHPNFSPNLNLTYFSCHQKLNLFFLLIHQSRWESRGNCVSGLFPRQRGSTNGFTSGWGFPIKKIFILSPLSRFGSASIAALNCQASPLLVFYSFKNLTLTKSAFSILFFPSTWAGAPTGCSGVVLAVVLQLQS